MKKGPDYILIGIVSLIVLLGLFVLASVSSLKSQEIFGHPYHFFSQQLLLGFLPGIILAVTFYKVPLNFIKKWSPLLLGANIFLLILVFFPYIGVESGGATRWIEIGPISFQPSELLKLTFILYLASWLSTRKKTKSKHQWSTFLPFIAVSAVIGAVLYYQPDVSTLGVIFMVAMIMYFIANTPLWHTLALLFGGAGLIFVLVQFSPYRLRRVQAMLNPDLDPLGMTYQIKQVLIAVGSGGLLGTGFGMSYQKFDFVPFTMTDSVFAIFAEEAGFIGSVFLISLFLLLFWRGFVIAKNNKDEFIKLIAIGITSWFFLQAFINIGSMIGLVPLTGIPLPFISYGKSHLIAEMAALGILLNASKKHGKKV